MHDEKPDDDVFPYYGNFAGGDPRWFEPDPECNTIAELRAWAAACAEFDLKGGRSSTSDLHLGLGTNFEEAGPWQDLSVRLMDRAVDLLCARVAKLESDRKLTVPLRFDLSNYLAGRGSSYANGAVTVLSDLGYKSVDDDRLLWERFLPRIDLRAHNYFNPAFCAGATRVLFAFGYQAVDEDRLVWERKATP
jgi:hypothetical protein